MERVIWLDLADVIAQMPPGLIRPLQDEDGSRRVLLKAMEIEKGMAHARPTVSIASVYEQVPEIFLEMVPVTDTREMSLPFAKVLEQFSKLELRDDQYRDQNVPQVETPFLQVTIEDNSKFGIPVGPIRTGVLPPVRIEPATAENIAAAEPDAITHARFSLGPRPSGYSNLPARPFAVQVQGQARYPAFPRSETRDSAISRRVRCTRPYSFQAFTERNGRARH